MTDATTTREWQMPGWRLVPVEPTEAMWDAGRDPVHFRDVGHYRIAGEQTPAWQINPDGTVENDKSKGTTAVHVWRAMLAAAPKAPPMPEEAYDAMLKIVGSAAMVMDEAAMKPFIEWARAQGLVSAKE